MRPSQLRFVLAIPFAILLSAAPIVALPDQFVPGCQLPFAAIEDPHSIDSSCPRRGDIPDPPPANDSTAPAHALQNEEEEDDSD
jgi:hypothetical protein